MQLKDVVFSQEECRLAQTKTSLPLSGKPAGAFVQSILDACFGKTCLQRQKMASLNVF